MAGWNLEPEYAALADDFGSLDAVFALEGECLTRDPLSEVIRVQRGGINYYVKRYVPVPALPRHCPGRQG